MSVNASCDAEPEDCPAADINDSISEIEDESNGCLAADNGGEVVLGFDEGKIYVDIYSVSLDNDYEEMVYFGSLDKTATGNLTVYVDNVPKCSRIIQSSDYDEYDKCYLNFNSTDLGISSPGEYAIKVTLQDKVLAQETVNVYEYTMSLSINGILYYGENCEIYACLPSDATGKLKFTINGKTYDVKYDASGYGSLEVNTAGWNLGEYHAVLEYEGDAKYSPDSRQASFYVNPKINYISRISVGENQIMTIAAPGGENGNAIIRLSRYVYETGEDVHVSTNTISITNGYGMYLLPGLSEGVYFLDIGYQFSTPVLNDYAYIEVVKNSPGFSSSISETAITKGENTTVNLNGPINGEVNVFVDCVEVNHVDVSDNQFEYIVSGLSAGTHGITVNFEGVDDVFYSNTFTVTVNDPANENEDKEKKELEYYCYVPETVLVGGNGGVSFGAEYYNYPTATGNVTMFVDNSLVYNEAIKYMDYETDRSNKFYFRDIPNLSVGNHSVLIKYEGDDNYNGLEINRNFTVDYFWFNINDEMNFNDVYFHLQISPSSGQVDFILDNRKIFSKILSKDGFNEYFKALNDLSFGNHTYELVYFNGDYPEKRCNGSFSVTYGFDAYLPYSLGWGDNATVYMVLPYDASADIKVLINGETHYLKMDENRAVTLSDLSFGENNITFSYQDERYPLKEIEKTLTVSTKFDLQTTIPYQSKDYNITFKLPGDASGFLVVRHYDKLLGRIPLINGTASCCISNLPIGRYSLFFEYEGNYTEFRQLHNIEIIPNVIVPYPVEMGEDYNISIIVNDSDEASLNISITQWGYYDDEGNWIESKETEIYNGPAKSLVFTSDDLNLGVAEYYVNVAYEKGSMQYSHYFDFAIRNQSGIWNIETNMPEQINRSEQDYFYRIEILNPIARADGILYFYVNGRLIGQYDSWYWSMMHINVYQFNDGMNNWTLEYTGDSYYKNTSVSGKVNVFGDVYGREYYVEAAVNDTVRLGHLDDGKEDCIATISAPKDAKGNVDIFINDRKVYTCQISPEIHIHPTDLDIALNPDTTYMISIEYGGDGKYESLKVTDSFYVEKTDGLADPNLVIEVASVEEGNPIIVSVKTNNAFSGNVCLKIDGKNYMVYVKDGEGKLTIPKLAVGTYTAKAIFNATDKFYSSVKLTSFAVTVKKASVQVKDKIKLTLKKVKVKKSAKKLVLKATLKINGKAVKGKKLTFKFNGKTYKAKTNKKGVAKVTVKKKVLKKLKVGKKVKYQVSYLKTTKKLTAKVKK